MLINRRWRKGFHLSNPKAEGGGPTPCGHQERPSSPSLPTHPAGVGSPYLSSCPVCPRAGSPRPVLGRKEAVSAACGPPPSPARFPPCPHHSIPRPPVSPSYLVASLVCLLHPGSPLVVEAEAQVRAVRVLLEPAQELLELAAHRPRARLATPRLARPAARARAL